MLLQLYCQKDRSHLITTSWEYENRTWEMPIPIGPLFRGLELPITMKIAVPHSTIKPGQTIKIYRASIQGKKITLETPGVMRFFNSFVLNID